LPLGFLRLTLPLQFKRGFLRLAFFLGLPGRFLGKPLPLGFLCLTLQFLFFGFAFQFLFESNRGLTRFLLFLGFASSFLGKPLPLQLKCGFLRLAFFFSLSFGFFRPPLQFLFFGFAFQFLFESNRRLTRFFLFLGSLRRLLR
jgi:hypothetical protein